MGNLTAVIIYYRVKECVQTSGRADLRHRDHDGALVCEPSSVCGERATDIVCVCDKHGFCYLAEGHVRVLPRGSRFNTPVF